MALAKYRKALLTCIIVVVPICVIILLSLGQTPGFALFPISNATDQIIIFLITMVSAIIFGYFLGYLLGPIFVFIHKNTIGRKMVYGIEERPQAEKFKGYFIKALWPALLAINLALYLSDNTTITDLITSIPSAVIADDPLAPWATFVALLPIMMCISMVVFSPALHLLDSGIVYHNKEKIKHSMDSTEVRNIGEWYSTILKGYAGIAVIINYYDFILVLTQVIIDNPGNITSTVLNIFSLITYPIVITIVVVPSIIVLDITRERRRRYLFEKVKKFQIEKPMDVQIS